MKGLIICGFPGVGKTTVSARSRDIIDLESTPYRRPVDWERLAKGEDPRLCEKDNPNWVKDYVDAIEQMAGELGGYKYVLVSTHAAVRSELQDRGLTYVCVIPDSETCYDEYMARYLRRGDPFEFMQKVANNWTEWLRDLAADPAFYNKCIAIKLRPNQVLADILPNTI